MIGCGGVLVILPRRIIFMGKALAFLFISTIAGLGNTYTTNFPSPPAPENPISESGNWINGGIQGIQWTNVRTVNGEAIGTMPGNGSGNAQYADSTAVLTGTWGPDQTVQATVVCTNPQTSSSVFTEVELRLRTTITPNSITGYECNASVSANSNNFYMQIVRWNGPVGSFTELDGREIQVQNGDIIKATSVGSTITIYLNGLPQFSVNDSMFPTGNPGIGMFLQGAAGINANYGLTNFSATDGASPTPSATPLPTATPSPTITPSPTPLPTPTSTPSVTPLPTPKHRPTPRPRHSF